MEHPMQQLDRRLRSLERAHHHLHEALRSGVEGGKDGDRKDGAIYSVTTAVLAAGASFSQAVQIDALSAFELQQIVGYAEKNGATFPQADNLQPQITLQISDGRENRTLFDQPLPWGMVVGVSKLPFLFTTGRLFSSNQSVTLSLKNFGAAEYDNVFVAMVGNRIFPGEN